MEKDYLFDREFLKRLDEYPHREVWAKIIALNYDEIQTEEIQGKVTGGSINIDGTSAVRRTCSLTIVTQNVNINDYYWGLNTKIKIEIGLTNDIDDRYPKTIWFPQGMFLITSFNESLSPNSHTISISGKDKMCLLNGEIAGSINALSWDFGTIDDVDEVGNVTNTKRLLKDIIRDAVREYAREPLGNIIIQDLDNLGVELLEYKGDKTLYMFIGSKSTDPNNYVFDDQTSVTFNGNNIKLTELNNNPDFVFNSLSSLDYDNHTIPSEIVYNNENCTLAKFNFGQTVGYRNTDLVYAGNLILSAGESITSMLDKIVAMLGDYEYFYDVDGHFVFRRKKTFLNTSWNNINNHRDELYVEPAAETSAVQYSFDNNQLFTAFQNTPNLNNLKNDYSLWGKRKSINGAEIPIHMRYAIDKKPTYYKARNGITYVSGTMNTVTGNNNISIVDWREIIYQMALDYNHYYYKDPDKFYYQLRYDNGYLEDFNWRYPWGITGYEQYYVDLEGFWRQLYCPIGEYYPATVTKEQYLNGDCYNRVFDQLDAKYYYFKSTDLVQPINSLVKDPKTGKNISTDQPGVPGTIYKLQVDADNVKYYMQLNGIVVPIEMEYNTATQYYQQQLTNKDGWFPDVVENPQLLNFWFDFLDAGENTEMAQYSVYAIGDRTKVTNDDNIKSIYFRDTPDAIFFDALSNDVEKRTGYTYLQAPEWIMQYFHISAQGKSAKDELDIQLYNYSYCTESVSITAIPIYYLEPNARIYINDRDTGINGEYIVSKLTLPLMYNGTMNITATRAVERLY